MMGQGKAQQAVFVVFKTDSKIEVVQDYSSLWPQAVRGGEQRGSLSP